MVVSWHKLDSTAKKTYPRVTSDKLIEDEKCAHYYTHKILSKTLNFEKKTGRINYIQSSQVNITANATLKKDLLVCMSDVLLSRVPLTRRDV